MNCQICKKEIIKKSNSQKYCKECFLKNNKEKDQERANKWYYKNWDKAIKQRRVYYRNNKEKFYNLSKSWRKKNPDKVKEFYKKYRIVHRNRVNARTHINNLIIAGKLKPAKHLKCKCGKQAREYHHYKGYNRKNWEDVEPKCTNCHPRDMRVPRE